MKLLIDTHCWLLSLSDPGRLNAEARDVLEDARNEVFVSAATAWEISIKHALGKLDLPSAPSEYVPSRIGLQGAMGLAVTVVHALRVSELPHHHRDPFNRLLVAQAQLESLTLLTADEVLRRYDVPLLWAT